MKKIFTLIAVAAMAMSVQAQSNSSWIFGEEKWHSGFDADGKPVSKEYAEAATIDGLTITATSSAKMTVDANKKTVDGVAYIGRLKTGGAGGFSDDSVEQRTVKFKVAGNSTIDIIASGSNSSDDRVLNIFTETYTSENKSTPNATIDIIAADGAKKYTYKYTGGTATTITLASNSGGINFYAIYATNVVTGINTVKAVEAENGAAYNLAGQKVADGFKGVVIKNGKKMIQK